MNAHDDLSSLSMMDLFRMEAANVTDGMTTALIDLESHPGDASHLEGLMRAAHSLKGAARIVGVDPLVALGHAMEDRLQGAQRSGLPLARHHVDALLQATALFAQVVTTGDPALPAWLASQHDPMIRLIAALGSDAPTETAAVPVPEASPPASIHDVAIVTPAAPTPVPVPVSAPAAEIVAPRTEAPTEPARQLRLEADQLETLLGLARESLLVNRAHERQTAQLERLRTEQRRVAAEIEQISEALRVGQPAERLRQLVDNLAQTQARCHGALVTHLQDHASQTRRGHRISTRLHHTINSTRMTRFASVSAAMKRLARDTAHRVDKAVQLAVDGIGTQIDRDVLDRIEAPLAHLVRNAIDHGLEDAARRAEAGKSDVGHVTVSARHHGGQLEVTVRDDGRGVDLDALRRRIVQRGLSTPEMLSRMSEQELLAFLFLPGFSTRDQVSETSGRGVGLDVVQTCVQSMRGSLRVVNAPGKSLAITLVLPVSLSLVRALLLDVAGEIYALPLSRLERVVTVPASSVRWVAGQPCVDIGGRDIAWTPLGPILGVAPPAASPQLVLVEIASETGRVAFAIDRLLGERDLALQALDARLPKPANVACAAVLDDGTPVLVLDVADLEVAVSGRGASTATVAEDSAVGRPARRRILVVEDSFTVREVERKVLAGGGYDVDVAVDGVDGWNALGTRAYDLVVTDVDMPRMNGLELLRRIRSSEATRSLPVMIVSYKDREEDRMAGLRHGANRYFVKSGFEESALLEAVADLIG